jgi:hypothetical protein
VTSLRPPKEDTLNQGKLVILFIFGLSAVMGGYAWWHHYNQGRKCLEFWGPESASLIRYAPTVEAMQLRPAEDDDAKTVQIGGESYAVIASKEISKTPGLVHARHALIDDGGFLWDAEMQAAPTWQYLLRYTDDDKEARVAMDCDQGVVRLVGTDRQATLNRHLADGYKSRLPKWLGLDAGGGVNASSTLPPATAGTP